MSENPKLSRIRVYPVKSLRGVDREIWELDDFGLRYDRRWMIVDPDGAALTQRDNPELARIELDLAGDGIRLAAPQHSHVTIPLEPEPAAAEPVLIWDDTVAARPASEDASRWLSEFLRTPCRLVYMPDETVRPVDPEYDPGEHRVSFTDGFPLLLLSEESMEELNRRMAKPLGIERFRPNLIVKDVGAPNAEDTWRRIRIGHVEMHVVKPCSRCVITATHPESGDRGDEPLQTLASYRRSDGKVWFAQNVIHGGTGTLRVGEVVQVLETGEAPAFDEGVPEPAAESAEAPPATVPDVSAAADEDAEPAAADDDEAADEDAGTPADTDAAPAPASPPPSAPPIELRFSTRPEPDDVLALFQAAGRKETAGDPAPGRIERTLEASNVVASAWRGDELVAVLRGWTDGARDGFLSDIVIHPAVAESSVGSELVRRTAAAHPGVTWVLRPSPEGDRVADALGWVRLTGGWRVSTD